MKTRQVMAMAIVGIMIAGGFLTLMPSTARAFPTNQPTPSQYIFYDNFEGTGDVAGHNGWACSQGQVTYSSDQAFTGSKSAKFDPEDGNNYVLQRTISQDNGSANTGLMFELHFYDNASVTSQSPEAQFRMVVGGAHATISLGFKLALPLGQRMYSYWYYDDGLSGSGIRNQTTGVNRTTGWHDFKIYVATTKDYSFFVDNTFVGNLTLTTSGATGGITYYNMFAVGSNGFAGNTWYVDQFLIYPFYQDQLWALNGVAVRNAYVYNAWAAIEPTVIYENGIYRCWYDAMATTGATGTVGYANSTDGIHWVDKGSSVTTMGTAGWRPFVTHIGNTYYLYYTNETGTYGAKHYMQRTSTDGLTWSNAVATNLGCSSNTSAWDHKLLGNINVWKEGATWYAIYEGGSNSTLWTDGLATSTDGLTWTKYANNPVLPTYFTGGGPDLHKIGSTYYLLVHGLLTNWVNNVPTDIYLYQSTDLKHWTQSSFFGQLTMLIGYWGQTNQVADPSYFEGQGAQAGRHFLMFEGTFNGTDAGRLYVAESKYSLLELGTGQVLQRSTQLLKDPGVTNNITAAGVVWYSGINAIRGSFNDNWTISYPTGPLTYFKVGFNAWDPANTGHWATVAGWTVSNSGPLAWQRHTINDLTVGAYYTLSRNGGALGVYYAPSNGTVSFNLTGDGTYTLKVGSQGSLGLPASLHQYVSLILVMVALVVVMPIIGLALKSKEHGISKEEVVGAVIFTVVGLIMLGILIAILGS